MPDRLNLNLFPPRACGACRRMFPRLYATALYGGRVAGEVQIRWVDLCLECRGRAEDCLREGDGRYPTLVDAQPPGAGGVDAGEGPGERVGRGRRPARQR